MFRSLCYEISADGKMVEKLTEMCVEESRPLPATDARVERRMLSIELEPLDLFFDTFQHPVHILQRIIDAPLEAVKGQAIVRKEHGKAEAGQSCRCFHLGFSYFVVFVDLVIR